MSADYLNLADCGKVYFAECSTSDILQIACIQNSTFHNIHFPCICIIVYELNFNKFDKQHHYDISFSVLLLCGTIVNVFLHLNV